MTPPAMTNTSTTITVVVSCYHLSLMISLAMSFKLRYGGII